MKIINQLVVQSDMPNDNNVVWVYGNTAKYYNNGTWTTLGESNEDRKELEEKVDSLDKEMGEVKKDLSILGSKQDVVELEIGDSNEFDYSIFHIGNGKVTMSLFNQKISLTTSDIDLLKSMFNN